MNRFFIIGYPCCGKTRFSRQAASHLNIPFFDSDVLVEMAYNMPIVNIFKIMGEEAFREKEHEVILNFCNNHDDYIMATGGGLPCFYDNMEVMNNAGITIYIKAPAETLAMRNFHAKHLRPKFAGMNEEQILQLVRAELLQRETFYSKAKYIIDGTTDDCAQQIEKIVAGTNHPS